MQRGKYQGERNFSCFFYTVFYNSALAGFFSKNSVIVFSKLAGEGKKLGYSVLGPLTVVSIFPSALTKNVRGM